MSERRYWLSSLKMTVGATTVAGVITETAPITRKFVGQPLENLVVWMRRQGGYEMVEYQAARPGSARGSRTREN
jgi:hypothetical protein